MAVSQGLCIVAPPESGEVRDRISPEQRQWVSDLRLLAQEREQEVAIFRTVLRTSRQRGQTGRRFFVLDPWEADRLYRLVHRGYDAVFQTGQARVLLNPTKMLETSNSRPLAQVVNHKAFFVQFDGITSASDTFETFDDWSKRAHCDSRRDCRVLPLHMFAPSRDWGALEAKDDRDAFEKSHGRPLQLKDEKARHWKQTNAWHGNDTLTIAKFELPTGFHWDVQSPNHTSRMSSLTAAWRFDSGAYVNVSPDGHVRGGQSKGVSAVKEGEAPRPVLPETPKAKKSKPRRKRNSAGTRS